MIKRAKNKIFSAIMVLFILFLNSFNALSLNENRISDFIPMMQLLEPQSVDSNFYHICFDDKSLNGWSIQIGVYSQKENAVSAQNTLLSAVDVWTNIQEIERDSRVLYRLICMREMNYYAVKKVLNQIKPQFPDAFISSFLNLKLSIKS